MTALIEGLTLRLRRWYGSCKKEKRETFLISGLLLLLSAEALDLAFSIPSQRIEDLKLSSRTVRNVAPRHEGKICTSAIDSAGRRKIFSRCKTISTSDRNNLPSKPWRLPSMEGFVISWLLVYERPRLWLSSASLLKMQVNQHYLHSLHRTASLLPWPDGEHHWLWRKNEASNSRFSMWHCLDSWLWEILTGRSRLNVRSISLWPCL